jgi:type VI secretion system protein ImpF
MSRIDPNQGLMPSVLDRLIDPDSGGTSWRRGYGIEQMVEAVRRDLEDLMNTRQTNTGAPQGFTEVERSIVGYGLPDLTSFASAATPHHCAEIARAIESAVGRFEPRLRNVRATLLDPGDPKQRTVRFRIEARLALDPAPEVAFDTIVELTTGQSSVQSAGT